MYALRISAVSFTTLLFFAAIFTAHGQVQPMLNVHVDPVIPGPNQKVSIRLESFSVDLNRSTISFFINEKLKESGMGLTTFEFTTGPIGTDTKFDVRVVGINGGRIDKSISFRPAAVDLLVDADTYTPPFYKGRSLPVMQSDVRIVAVPSFSAPSIASVPASDIVFTWKRDFKTIPEQSGRGRDVLKISGDHLYTSKGISLTAVSAGKSLTAQGSAGIVIQEPKIIFYRNDPLLGVRYDRALSDTYRFAGKELSIRPELFFFSRDTITKELFDTTWTMNGKQFAPLPGRFAVFRNEGEGRGSASLSLQVVGVEKLIQAAAANLNLQWDGAAPDAFSPPRRQE